MKKCNKDCKYADVEDNICTYEVLLPVCAGISVDPKPNLNEWLGYECPVYCATSMPECKDECDKWATCTGSEGKPYGVTVTKIIGKSSEGMTPEEVKPRVKCIKRHRAFYDIMRERAEG